MAKKPAKSDQEQDAQLGENFITIGGEKFSLDNASEEVKKALNTLRYTERKIIDLRGEMAMASIARTGLISILRTELSKSKSNS